MLNHRLIWGNLWSLKLKNQYKVFFIVVVIHRKPFLLLFYYSCPSFPLCPPPPSPPRPHSPSPPRCPCPWVIHTCSLTSPFPFLPQVLISASSLMFHSVFLTYLFFCACRLMCCCTSYTVFLFLPFRSCTSFLVG